MMTFALADHVYAAETGGQLILLDIRRSRYLGVPAAVRDVLVDPQKGDAQPETAASIAALERAGLVVDRIEGPRGASTRSIPLPTSEWRGQPSGYAFSSLLLARALALQVDTAWRLRARALAHLLGRLRSQKLQALNRRPQCANDRIGERVAHFRRSHRIIAPGDRCLMKSMALFRFLIASDARVDLVLGVRTAPFAAHAWIQCDGVLLDDELDRVRLFTPILSL